MNHLKLRDFQIEERSFGSSFDPLLNGVAQGLARLFPPVDDVRVSDETEAEATRDTPNDGTLEV